MIALCEMSDSSNPRNKHNKKYLLVPDATVVYRLLYLFGTPYGGTEQDSTLFYADKNSSLRDTVANPRVRNYEVFEGLLFFERVVQVCGEKSAQV